MSLTVVILNATNVPNVETFGKSDPYVSVEFQGRRFWIQIVWLLPESHPFRITARDTSWLVYLNLYSINRLTRLSVVKSRCGVEYLSSCYHSTNCSILCRCVCNTYCRPPAMCRHPPPNTPPPDADCFYKNTSHPQIFLKNGSTLVDNNKHIYFNKYCRALWSVHILTLFLELCPGQKKKTEHKKGELNPNWNEVSNCRIVFSITVVPLSDTVPREPQLDIVTLPVPRKLPMKVVDVYIRPHTTNQ